MNVIWSKFYSILNLPKKKKEETITTITKFLIEKSILSQMFLFHIPLKIFQMQKRKEKKRKKTDLNFPSKLDPLLPNNDKI